MPDLGQQEALAQVGRNGWHGWKADWRLRMCSAEWLTLRYRRGDLVGTS
jgi:hypothetical protein